MLTRSEKTYLALTLAFLGAGSGIKAWRQATVKLGPYPDPVTLAQDSARSADSLAIPESLARAEAGAGAGPEPGTGPADSGTGFRGGGARSSPLLAPDGPGLPAGGSEGSAEGGHDDGLAGAHPVGGRIRKTSTGSVPAGQIDLNRADAAALMRIPGVGAKTAEAILAWRRAHGPFRDLRDLLNIKGIGEKKLEKLVPHIIL